MTLSRLQTDAHMSGERAVCPAYCPTVPVSCCLAVSVSRSDSAAAANCGCLLQHSLQITEISHNSPAVAVASSRCHDCPDAYVSVCVRMCVCVCLCLCVFECLVPWQNLFSCFICARGFYKRNETQNEIQLSTATGTTTTTTAASSCCCCGCRAKIN